MRLGCRHRRCIAGGEVCIELGLDCPELTLLELGDTDAAPAFGGADQRREHQVQDDALAKGVGDHLGASPLLAKQPLQEVGGADRPAVSQRETQMRDAGLEVVLETGRGARQVAAIGRPKIVAQQPRQSRRGGLVAGRGAGLELGPDVQANRRDVPTTDIPFKATAEVCRRIVINSMRSSGLWFS